MSEVQRGNRKSSLRGYEEFLDSFDNIDLDSFIKPFFQLQEDYIKIGRKRLPKCHSITYKGIPDILYIAFGEKDKCKSEATKYFRDNFHPAFMGNNWRKCHTDARAIRRPNFDKYYKEKKIPIEALMTLDVRIPCCICGKGDFGLTELEYKQCFVVEGEGDLNVFTKGLLVCKECFNKYIK